MSILSENPLLFLIVSTLIGVISIKLNNIHHKDRVRPDKAFWYAWLTLIWSAEFVTNVNFSGKHAYYYNSYAISPGTRELVIYLFLCCAIGFFIGSVVAGRSGTLNLRFRNDVHINNFDSRYSTWICLLIFLLGIFEFLGNISKSSNLLELRTAAVTGEIETSTFYTQFFLFSMSYLIFLGCSHGIGGKMIWRSALLAMTGIIIHNLAVGGRINVVVAPALYYISYMTQSIQLGSWDANRRRETGKTIAVTAIAVIFAFTAIKLVRTAIFDVNALLDASDFIVEAFFAAPMYISDALIAVKVHVDHAWQADVPLGAYSFDSFYRLAKIITGETMFDSSNVFGHLNYRDTADPWAWTQTNLIPRLIADFGEYWWLGITLISALFQFIGLYRIRISFLGVCIRVLMIFSAMQSIVAAGWFSSFNTYIILYAILIKLAFSSRIGKPKKYER